MEEDKLKVGDIAWCYYYKFVGDAELDLFYCKIIELGTEYSTCELYYGETFDPTKVKGTFKDICTSDIKPLTEDDKDNIVQDYRDALMVKMTNAIEENKRLRRELKTKISELTFVNIIKNKIKI